MRDIENNLNQVIEQMKEDLNNVKNLEELKQLRSRFNKLEVLNQVKEQLKLT